MGDRTQGCLEARVAASQGSQPFNKTGKSSTDGRVYTTIYEGFKIGKHIARKYGDNRCLGFRTERAAIDIGSEFIRLGENNGQNTFIDIYAVNNVEWLITALACHSYSVIYVSLYDILGESAIIYIMNQSGIILLSDDMAHLKPTFMPSVPRL
ncbi:unnamed protein product [Rotaria sp. Silwood1]|nr:unnamed protein product [Rotaria sp. Silwood1]CAF1671240.1 unnamed protein product [Rotaria sp. Silwood1]